MQVNTENATFEMIVDNERYMITPQITSDLLLVKNITTDEEIEDIYAATDEVFIEQIRKIKEIKKLMLVLKNKISFK